MQFFDRRTSQFWMTRYFSKTQRKKYTTGPIWNSNYKTIMCASHISGVVCVYGNKCQFAHGHEELIRWNARQKKIDTDIKKKHSPNPPENTKETTKPAFVVTYITNMSQILDAKVLFKINQ